MTGFLFAVTRERVTDEMIGAVTSALSGASFLFAVTRERVTDLPESTS